MSLVTRLESRDLERNVGHREAEETYSVLEENGEIFLQIDTYGSASRKDKTPGHRAQSIRFSPAAIAELRKILQKLS
jgi:guanylate kinase